MNKSQPNFTVVLPSNHGFRNASKAEYIPAMLKNFLALSLSLAVLFLSVVSYIHDTFRRSEQTIVEADEAHTVALQARAVENNLKDIASDLRILASLAESHDPAQRHCLQWLHHTEAQFLNFTLYKQRYDQIRILDRDGMETLRIDDRQGHPKVTPRDQLQSKANRYYFTEAFVLDPGRIYVSPLDLNIERDVIEQPPKPMIRFAMPLFDLDQLSGANPDCRPETDQPGFIG